LTVFAVGVLVIGFLGGLIGSSVGSDSPASSNASTVVDDQLKGSVTTTVARSTGTIKPGTITVPKTLPIQQVPGPPGPAGPQGPAGPAGKDGKGFQSIQWINVGGEFEGCCGEWLVSCPAGTTPIGWQALGLAGAAVSYAGRGFYNDNPNEWMFRASDDRGVLQFSNPVARFALGCMTVG